MPPTDPTRTAPPPTAPTAAPPTEPDLGATEPTADIPPPNGLPTLDGYDLVRELGRGGMGVVYLATQTHLNRSVAIKMLLADRGAASDSLRFLAEAEAVAAVDHPGVVRVYGFGRHDGNPYLVMEHLPGGTLADRILNRNNCIPKEAATLVAKLARGVQAAHAAGVIHRDLKPSNVLFDAADEPKVTDFGLAKRSTGSDLTHTGTVFGTPAYMAPEQADGQGKFACPPADVWALGVILYELLAGRRPFTGGDPVAVMRAVIDLDPPRLRDLVPGLPQDAELICLKCLSKDPAERYTTAAALATDLERFAAGDSVSVRPARLVERAAKWAKRKPTAAAAWALGLTAVGVSGFALTTGLLWREAEAARTVAERNAAEADHQRQTAERNAAEADAQRHRAEAAAAEAANRRDAEATARKDADAARGRADTARTQAEQARDGERQAKDRLTFQTYARNVDLAYREYQANNTDRARQLLAACPDELRHWEWHYVHRLCYGYLYSLKTLSGKVKAVAFSPDSKFVVAADWEFRKNVAVVFAAADGRRQFDLTGHTDYVRSVVYRADGARIATVSDDGTAREWDATTGRSVRTVVVSKPGSRQLQAVTYSPNGRLALVTIDKRTNNRPDELCQIWDWSSGRMLAEVGRDAVFAPDGRVYYYNAPPGDDKLSVYDPTSGVVRTVVAFTEDNPIVSFALSPDGSRLAVGHFSTAVDCWDTATGKRGLTLPGTGASFWVSFSADGRNLLTTTGGLRVWRTATGEERLSVRPAADPTLGQITNESLKGRFSPDGRWLWTGDPAGGRTDIRNITTGRVVCRLTDANTEAEFSPDGSRLAIIGQDNVCRVWDVTRQGEHAAGSAQPDDLPDTTTVHVTLDGGGAAVIPPGWDGKPIRLAGHPSPVQGWFVSPDGRWAVTAANDKVRVWELPAGRCVATIPTPADLVAGVGISPDAKTVLVVGAGGTLTGWDLPAGRPRYQFPQREDHERLRAVITFHPNGTRALIADRFGGSTNVIDVQTGHTVCRFEPLSDRQAIIWAAFHPDSRRVATAHRDHTLRLWDTITGQPTLTVPLVGSDLVLTVPEEFLKGSIRRSGVRFSRDGRRIEVQKDAGGVTVFDTTPVCRDLMTFELAPLPRPGR